MYVLRMYASLVGKVYILRTIRRLHATYIRVQYYDPEGLLTFNARPQSVNILTQYMVYILPVTCIFVVAYRYSVHDVCILVG